ncbi:hypothetical protein FisN_9Lh073 [Fistulifera solaris]|uniref:Uncharacterized protein n=1 Tax=Fistulifera solaris TaxID=1519565 RepID=A0A1Z5KKF6_FISSO|nr:hypothetical protein FisN_9Lh073 [Fistulifera solaris]|eukprot:GAX26804.1 hypothetical protein FisN_9Lh073 [Fistulifera solaris]
MRLSFAATLYTLFPAVCHGFGTSSSRRTFLSQSSAALIVATTCQQPAHAIPMVTINEFRTILRDSARSIARVEFSGPRQETVTVVLQDGTTFGISDVIDSSVDPRSPLQVQAMCRENDVPVKFTELEALLQGKGRGKLYTNERVQQANLKEQERLARMAQDEVERQDALKRMEGQL